ncbi:MAG: hypothetical protein R6V85_03435 [Polyangia bacterium]
MRSISAAVAVGALLLASGPAVAAGGKLEVSLKDDKGVTINGKVTARKGEAVESCTTAAGSCTLTGLAAGVWKVSAKTTGGAESGSKSVTVKNDHTSSTSLVLKKSKLILLAEQKGTKVVRSLGGAVELQTAKLDAVEDLGSGSKLKASGTTKDEHGVTINGKVTVEKDGEVVGRSETAAGKYEVYDLSPGTYTFCFESNGGKKKTRSVVIKNSIKVTVNFQL